MAVKTGSDIVKTTKDLLEYIKPGSWVKIGRHEVRLARTQRMRHNKFKLARVWEQESKDNYPIYQTLSRAAALARKAKEKVADTGGAALKRVKEEARKRGA